MKFRGTEVAAQIPNSFGWKEVDDGARICQTGETSEQSSGNLNDRKFSRPEVQFHANFFAS